MNRDDELQMLSEVLRACDLGELSRLHAGTVETLWAHFQHSDAGARGPFDPKLPEPARVELVRQFAIRRFTSLVYPDKPQMAQWLTEWTREFAVPTPDKARVGGIFAEPRPRTPVQPHGPWAPKPATPTKPAGRGACDASAGTADAAWGPSADPWADPAWDPAAWRLS